MTEQTGIAGTRRTPAHEGTLTALLDAAVRDHPDAVAVRERRRRVDYAELERISNCVATALTGPGPLAGHRVGVWLNKSVESVAALHAVLRCGAAYVPVDPTAPPRRAAAVLADSGASWLITSPERARSLRSRAPRVADGLSVLSVGADDTGAPAAGADATWEEALTRYAGAPPVRVPVAPDDIAYLLYTSGSTGTPKGVVLTHAAARAFVDWAAAEFALTFGDVLAGHAPFHFDLSVLDLFGAAACAGSVALVPESIQGLGSALVRFAAEQEVSVWYSVPTALRRMVEAPGEGLAGTRLRVVAFAGEEYPTRHLRALHGALPAGTALYNLYGPTETNVCTFHRLGPDDLAEEAAPAPPIGRPCPYATVFLRAPDGAALPETGEHTGELCVTGASVMRGYWNDADKTAAAFVEHAGRRHHRTGDVVRRRADGLLVYAGREDTMVKVKGHRVELGEIEAVLDGRGDVADAVCVITRDPEGQGGDRLAAFVTAAPGTTPDTRELRRHCRDFLPGYMVPEHIEVVPALDYTSTGKVDRRSLALRAPAER
ncbi:amino acid adenylation domain-containing protein [Streptomyces sp. NPDC093260]|uniref:amino acid adenylation domain-containing protein n=1 Tax=Streptomyces sp. NPDC093260 TaxID=3155073 RepID=UPI003421F696